MYRKFLLPIVGVGLAIALASSATSAMAEPANSTVRVAIDYSGMDLTSVQGRRDLDRRVNLAIEGICGQPMFGTRDEAEVLRQCRREIRAAVEPQIATALVGYSAKDAPPR